MSASDHPYRLTPRAVIDLEDIWLYTFQNWSFEQADRYQNEIMAAVAALANGTRKAVRSIYGLDISNIWPGRITSFIAGPT